MYALWLDTANAFGSVNHQVVWSILRAYGLPEADVHMLETLHAGSRYSIHGPFGTTAQIHTHTGINQGDITSPLIWNLVVNALIRYVDGTGQGYLHEAGVRTTALAYIDDAVLLSDTSKGFTKIIHRLNRFYDWSGLRVNHDKCAIFAHNFSSSKSLSTAQYLVHGKSMPPLGLHGSYKYLGMEVSPGRSWTREKQRVRRKLRECITALKGSPYLPNQLDQVVRACLLLIFRYGAGLVDWTPSELQQITRVWANARRLAWKIAPGSQHALDTLGTKWGGDLSPPHTCCGLRKCMAIGRCFANTMMTCTNLLDGSGRRVENGLVATQTRRQRKNSRNQSIGSR